MTNTLLWILGLVILLFVFVAACGPPPQRDATQDKNSDTYRPTRLSVALELDRQNNICYTAVDRWMMRRAVVTFRPIARDCTTLEERR